MLENITANRVLVVGSWAKEEITVEHIKRTSPAEVHAFLDIANPGIIEKADSHRIGNSSNPDEVIDYALEQECDLVLVTTAAPLEHGLADALEEADITGFAPPREAARLEWDKSYARQLLRTAWPAAVPRFEVCEDSESAFRISEELDWQVAVKPIGLTEGLGVKVYGDQLQDPDAVRHYIDAVLEEGIGGRHRVLIEECLIGEEFTLQALVDGERMVPTPAIQDFKKLLPGERGPNTASMGSYAASGRLLPFLTQSHYDEAVEVMRATLRAVYDSTGVVCRGFLYGQFMVTRDGVKLIEYNFRPGDPEWLNTLATLETPLLDVVAELLRGGEPQAEFRDEASVVKYLVPERYPEELDQVLDVQFDVEALTDMGVDVYYSAGLDAEERLNVGSERGLCLLACAASIEQSHQMIEKAIDEIDGPFAHRPDIGSAALLRSKKQRVERLLEEAVEFRRCRQEDASAVHRFVASCPPLEAYPLHQYKILLRYFGSCSFVAERDSDIAAFEMGLPSERDPGTYFLWQIGVAAHFRGQGLAGRLLSHIEGELCEAGFERIEVTIDPDNTPSLRAFEKAGYRNISTEEDATVEKQGHQAVRDYYGPGRHFVLLSKSLRRD